MEKNTKRSVLSAERFITLLVNGKIRKNILPNTSEDYTENAEKKDLIKYKSFISSSVYDEILNSEVRKYNADE